MFQYLMWILETEMGNFDPNYENNLAANMSKMSEFCKISVGNVLNFNID